MAITKAAFVYADPPHTACGPQDFVLRIPVGIRSKPDLLLACDSAGRFPDYFGRNWDALLDCLRDFSWIADRRIVIVHEDLPLRDSPEECRTYLEILHQAATDWSEPRAGPFLRPLADWPYVEHELLAAFPTSVEVDISRLLAGSAKGSSPD
jgi:RNAse (barnase) inhibitor barstar